jgi:hypothetical protein
MDFLQAFFILPKKHNEFGVPIETVSRMLGNTSIRTSQQWYVKTNMKKVMKEMVHVKSEFKEAV